MNQGERRKVVENQEAVEGIMELSHGELTLTLMPNRLRTIRVL
jgi:hypothetical protein